MGEQHMDNNDLKINLINFGTELNDAIISSIEVEYKIKINQHMVRASLNLKKNSSYIQVHDVILNNRELFSNEFFIINLPGLPIYAAFLIAEIHALTGKFPVVVECIKDYSNDGIFSQYKFKRLYDLDRERTQSRENYKGC